MAKISVLLYVDTDEADKIQACMDSLQNIGLRPNQIQLVWLDPYGAEALEEKRIEAQAAARNAQNVQPPEIRSAEELLAEFRGTVCRADVTGRKMWEAYNEGLKLADGEYVTFSLATSKYSMNAMEFLPDFDPKAENPELTNDECLHWQNLISLMPRYAVKNGGQKKIRSVKGKGIIDAEEQPWNVQPVPQAYLIRRDFLKGRKLREELREQALTELLLQLLSENRGKFWFQRSSIYRYSAPLEDMPLSDLPEVKWWYEDSVRDFLIPFMRQMEKEYDGNVPVYLQSVIYYLLCAKYSANLSGNNKMMLSEEEVPAFYELTSELLGMIDNEVIYQNGPLLKLKMPRALRMLFLKGKAEHQGYHLHFEECDNVMSCSFADRDETIVTEPVVIGDLSNEVLNIQVINYRDGKLEIDGFFQGAAFLDYSEYSLVARIEGKEPQELAVKRTEVYALLKCFGETYARKYAAHIDIPVEAICGGDKKFAVYIRHGGVLHQLQLKFTSMNSRLLTYSQKAYWRFDQKKFVLYRRGNCLFVRKSGAWDTFKREVQLLALLAIQKDHKEAAVCVRNRLKYWLTQPFYSKKRIWLTFDKLYKAGDNGEYFFQYCERQNDGIDCYYVINKDAPDYERLVKEHGKHILIYNTWRCRLMALRAEAVMATHAGTSVYLGFKAKHFKYFKDLFHADNICIQHGLSIQKIANFQNRLYANTKLYCLASPFERDNVAHAIYGYEPEMLKLTGLARYDGLKSKEKKQILITPTWRKNVVHTEGVGKTNQHSSFFKETAYYRIYNSLINDETLISCAKKLGYRIIFLLHPAMSAQIDDYERNDYVELLQATGDMSYEKILTESSLMVTDYSGVQFDFAYQRKPILYYHPDELPPHYTEGGLIYSTMGFGPICTNHEQIISELCGYMENGCRMKDEYRERADKFFTFDDFNNAQRIYQEVLKFEASK